MPRVELEKRKLIVHKWIKNKLSYRKLAKEFKCSKSAVAKIIKKYGEECTFKDIAKKNFRTGPANLRKEVKAIRLLRQEKTISVRQIARKVGVCVGTVQNIKRRNNIKTYKKQKIPKRSVAQQQRAKYRSRKLYKILLKKKNRCILMDDETYIKMDLSTLAGPQFFNAIRGSTVPDEIRSIRMEKFGSKVLVWQAICSCGKRSTPFFTTGTIKGENYRKECLEKRLFPLYQKHVMSPLFWPDLASAHYAADTLNLLKSNRIDFVKKEHNPPNCPNLRPIERYWAIMKRLLLSDGQELSTIEDFKKNGPQLVKKFRKLLCKTL